MNKPRNLHKPQMYDLVFISGGKVKETVLFNSSKALCLNKKRLVQDFYKNGILITRPIEERKNLFY